MAEANPAAPAADPQIEAYLAHLRDERRASPHTLANYRRDLLRLQTLCGRSGPPRPLAELSTAELRRAAAQLHAQGLQGRSIARALSAWRGLYRWLRHTGVLASDPTVALRAPRSAQRLPAHLRPEQAAALLDAQAPDDHLEQRDHAMAELFYSSGLRLSELAMLSLGPDVDLANGELRVCGKRGKTRIVPVGKQALAALHAWLPVRATLVCAGETALFVGRNGHRLGVRSIQLRLARWAVRSGLAQHLHPHMLRHSFASHLLQSSGDLRAVQELLGHASIRATQVYTHLDFQHLAMVYDAAHPRAHADGGKDKA